MSSLTLNQKIPRRGSSEGWKSWRTLSGWDYTDNAVGFYVVYSASLSLTDDQRLTSCSVTTRFTSQGSTSNRTLSCYLYTWDPTGSSSPPSGYTAVTSVTANFDSSGINQTFTFSNLDLRSSTALYFWFVDVVSGASDLQWSDNASVSGTFSAVALTLSLSSDAVYTGNKQVATIGNGSGRTLTVSVYYGNTRLYSAATSTGSLTVPVTKSWFTTAGLTSVKSFSASVRIEEDSSVYESFTVNAGRDMDPAVVNVTMQIVQSGSAATYFPNTYIAGVSRCKVTASVATGSNAAIASVKVTYPGGTAVPMTYNSSTNRYEGTTAALTVDTAFTVTATDQRGLSGAASSSQITVVQYSKPAINISAAYTYRCSSSGVQENGGAYWRARATATYYRNLSGNSLLQFDVKLSDGAAVNLTSGVQTAAQGGTLSPTARYTLIFTIQDKVSDPITKSCTLESMARSVVIQHNSTGTVAGIGTTPTRTAGSAVELPLSGAYLIGGMNAQSFHIPLDNRVGGQPFNKDFLNVNLDNRLAEENAISFFVKEADASGWENCPSGYGAQRFTGLRGVLWWNGFVHMVYIIEFSPVQGQVWTNLYYGSSWSGWSHTVVSNT